LIVHCRVVLEYLQKLARIHNLNSSVLSQVEQVGIAGHHERRASFDGSREVVARR
jgi:hypothetical protein